MTWPITWAVVPSASVNGTIESCVKTSSSETRHHDLGRHQRHQHQDVGGARAAAAPAREADREQHAERRRDHHVEPGELEAVDSALV